MRFPGFIGPSYTLGSVNVDCQNCINFYPEANILGTGKEHESMWLAPTPGLKRLATLPTGPVRALWRASNDTLYAVGGDKLYLVSSAYVATEIGTLQTSTGPVSIADNGLQLVIVDGTYGYGMDLPNSGFVLITDPDFPGADQVTFQDGYMIFNKINSEQFFLSGLRELTFDGLDIATAEALPDKLVGLLDCNQNLYLFGTQTIEVFYDSGDLGFPFARIQGAAVNVGCISAFSIARMQGAMYWVGGDETGNGIVYMMQGFQPQRISTSAVESVIRGLTTVQLAQARAWVYQQSGHSFYCLNLPGTNSTWVYDTSTHLWHERAYLGQVSQERHRADCAAVVYGQVIVGDYANGNIYALDPLTTSDDGNPVPRIRTAPHISKEMNRVFHTKFQLDFEPGVGLDGVGQGTDPVVILQWSDDGGHSWSSERTASMGKIGETKKRAIWRRLGSARDRVYRVKVTDPVKVALIGADLELVGGTS